MNKLILLLIAFLCFFSCKTEGDQSKHKSVIDILGRASPIQLERNEKTILLEDYFLDVTRIEEVQTLKGISASLSEDKKELKLLARSNIALLSEMIVKTKDRTYSFLLKAPQKKTTQLVLKDNGYKKVQVKGEMNNWNPNQSSFTKSGDSWKTTFVLNPGDYQYIFVVDDGKELLDPENEMKLANGFGGFNSLLRIPKPDPSKIPYLRTKSFEGNKVVLQKRNLIKDVFVFVENQRVETEEKDDQIIFSIPPKFKSLDRSFVRVWSYNDAGMSNDLLIPLKNGLPVKEAAELNRHDKEAQIMYFTLLDRFNNGNKKNDAPVNDKRLLPVANYQGGDIAGITAKIKDGYFEKLGINALWLSPITQNPATAFQEFPEPKRFYSGYHGYWPISSSKIDHRFGTDEDLHQLVKTAHENDINILLDYVCNHVHKDHPIYKKHPEWGTILDLPDGRKNIRIWDEHRLTTWFDTFLPTLDLSNPEVVDLQTDSTLYWVKKFNLDGFRHDATKHIPEIFWRTLTRKLKQQIMLPENRSLYQIGETYGSRDLIQSYIGSGMLDSQFDFNMYFAAREVFAKKETSFEQLANAMQETFNYYGHHSTMGYISGNHDAPRFISYASGALRFDENDREAGFTRDIQVKDSIGYKRLQQLHAYNLMIPGVPVIFYGDEIGMPGAGDPDNRRMMRFDSLNEKEQETREIVQSLAEFRRNRMSMIYGDTEILHQDKETFVFARYYFDEITIAVFNKSNEEKTISVDFPKRFNGHLLKAHFDTRFMRADTNIEFTLKPSSFDIITEK